jgi:hypothetical protein
MITASAVSASMLPTEGIAVGSCPTYSTKLAAPTNSAGAPISKAKSALTKAHATGT